MVLLIQEAPCSDLYSYDGNGNLAYVADNPGLEPNIVMRPKDVISSLGLHAGFSVISNDLGITYQWKLNNTGIPGATGDSLFLTNLTPAEFGSYTVVVSNAHGSVTSNPAMLRMDANTNGIPDDWEMTYIGNLDQVAGADFDGDGISNGDEYEQGTNPASAASYAPRLSITALGGSVQVSPVQEQYTLGQTVTLTATPTPGNQFTTWTGGVTGTTNPITLVLDGHKSVTATFRNARIWGWGNNQFSQTTNDSQELLDTVSLAAGGDFSLALKADGTVRGWGNNFASQAPPYGLGDVIAISAGNWQGFALHSDGKVQSWGGGASGAGTDPKVPPGLANVVAIQGSRGSGTALKANGTVVTWGGWVPQPPAGLSGVMALAAGQSHGVALKLDGTVVAWGQNNVGQTNVPAGLNDVVAISSGNGESSHTLALKADGTVVAWGYNNAGQCNVPAGLTNVVAIAASDYHNLALKSDGTVVCWGINNDGQCTLPTGMAGIVAIAAGSRHSLALAGLESNPLAPVIVSPPSALAYSGMPFHHRIAAMHGANSFTASGLPDGLVLDESTGVISGNTNVLGYVEVSLTSNNGTSNSSSILYLNVLPLTPEFTFATTMDARLGNPFSEVLVEYGTTVTANGLPAGLSYDSASRRIVGTPLEAGIFHASFTASHSTNTDHIVRKSLDIIVREVVGWTGLNPQRTLDGLTGVDRIEAGWDHYLALRNDGTVASWWRNGSAIGDIPPGLADVVAISAGNRHNLALKADGTLAAWGLNATSVSPIPPAVGNVVAISSGFSHNLVLRADGSLLAWGVNDNGQVDIPTGLGEVIAISAGSGHNLVLRKDGTVVAWGANNWGQRNVPAGLTDVVAIRAGHTNSTVLKRDGTVVTWGNLSANVTDAVAISNWLALRKNGTVVNVNGSALPLSFDNAVGVAGGEVAHLSVEVEYGKPVIVGAASGLCYVGAVWHHRFTALHGPSIFSATGLPDGLLLNASTGELTGSATAAGVYDIQLTATNAQESVSSTYRLHVLVPLPQFIAGEELQIPFVNPSSIQVVKFADSSEIIGLPAGLVHDSVGGLLSGTPTQSGAFAMQITATNSRGTATKTMNLAVAEVVGNITPAPASLTGVRSVTAGSPPFGGIPHYLAVKNDGTVIAWGNNSHGQTDVPAGLSGVVMVAGGVIHSLALKDDGTVVGWGENRNGRITIPAGLTNAIAIASYSAHSLALKADGTVVGWGYNDAGQISVPSGLNGVVAIATGIHHSLALKADGTVVAWGTNWDGRSSIPVGLIGAVAIAADEHSVALDHEGRLHTWGNAQPAAPGIDNYVAVAAGLGHSLALRRNGSVVGWGSDTDGKISAVSSLQNVTSISAGYLSSLVTLGDAPPRSPVPLRGWLWRNFGHVDTKQLTPNSDSDYDGIPDLMEFAMGTSPLEQNPWATSFGTQPDGTGVFEVIFSRSKSASASVEIIPEWSDALVSNWTTSGIIQTLISTSGDIELVQASIPTENSKRRFVRLRSTGR